MEKMLIILLFLTNKNKESNNKKMSEFDKNKEITLLSCDGESFKVSVQVAQMSETVKHLIEDTGIETPIPLSNVTGKILKKVIEYSTHHTENQKGENGENGEKGENGENGENGEQKTEGTEYIDQWDKNFVNIEQSTLFELILAANYLDIKCLLKLTCKTVANMIKGKNREEIKQMFGIKNDFTPEEEEKVRKENEWCEEK